MLSAGQPRAPQPLGRGKTRESCVPLSSCRAVHVEANTFASDASVCVCVCVCACMTARLVRDLLDGLSREVHACVYLSGKYVRS